MKILLVVYDNDSHLHWFPMGLAYIAAVLRDAGHEVTIYNQDLHHTPDEHLTTYLDEHPVDVVGLSVVGGYYQYRRLLGLSAAIRRAQHRPRYVLGGHGPAPEPEYFFRKTGADVIVIGEGERTVLELVQAFEAGRSLQGVAGIAYREGDQVVVNPRRELIADIDTIPLPAYDLFPIEYYRLLRLPHCTSSDLVMPVLSGRGCWFTCNFCYRMDKGFRARSDDAIVDEIRFLKSKYGITYIGFGDELLMSSVKRTASLCEAFLAADLRIRWECNGRLNYAKSELLTLMKRSGCVFINYGIEAFDDQILKNMHKSLTTQQIVQGIEATLQAGISPGFNIIFGNIGESRETLERGVEFLLKYDDGAQLRTIRPVTPYPGSPLYYHALAQGLLKDCEDFYEHKHVNSDLLSVNFTTLSDTEFHAALFEANRRLLENYFTRRAARAIAEARQLYLEGDATFRGFRHS